MDKLSRREMVIEALLDPYDSLGPERRKHLATMLEASDEPTSIPVSHDKEPHDIMQRYKAERTTLGEAISEIRRYGEDCVRRAVEPTVKLPTVRAFACSDRCKLATKILSQAIADSKPTDDLKFEVTVRDEYGERALKDWVNSGPAAHSKSQQRRFDAMREAQPSGDLDSDPVGECDRCGRKTWDQKAVGCMDHLTQPHGGPCGGTFNGLPARTI